MSPNKFKLRLTKHIEHFRAIQSLDASRVTFKFFVAVSLLIADILEDIVEEGNDSDA